MGRPNRKLQILAVIGVLGLVVAVCLLMPGARENERKKPQPPATAKAEKGGMPAGAGAATLPVQLVDGIGRVGKASSPVKVDVYVPGHSGCGNTTADFLYRVYKANQDKMQVVFVDFESPGGQKYQEKEGTHCQGIAVNGKQEYQITRESGVKKTVKLSAGMGDSWGQEELLKILDQEFQKAYGKPANHKLPPPKSSPAGPTKGGVPGAMKGPAPQGKA